MVKNLNADGRRGHSTLIAVILLKQKSYPYYNFGKARKAKRGHWTNNAIPGRAEVFEVYMIKEKHVQ